MAATDVACPFCGETIKSTAKKCKHCGEFLEPGLTREAILEKRAAEAATQAAAPAPVETSPAPATATPAPAAAPAPVAAAPAPQAAPSPVVAEAPMGFPSPAVPAPVAAAPVADATAAPVAATPAAVPAPTPVAAAPVADATAAPVAATPAPVPAPAPVAAAPVADATAAPVTAAPVPVPVPVPGVAAVAAVAPFPAAEAQAAATANLLAGLYQQIGALPDSDEKKKLLETLKALEEKKDEGDESGVEEMVKNVAGLIPDVAEVAINTLINPASGVTTLIQKVAKRVAESQKK